MPRERRNDARYARYTAGEVVASYRALAGRAWPGLRAIIEYACFDGEPLVLEGVHLEPAVIRDWLAGDGAACAGVVMPVFLVREDPADIARALRRGGHARDWVTTQTRDDATYARIAAMVALYSATVRAEAEAAGFPVFAMDGDLANRVARVLASLSARA